MEKVTRTVKHVDGITSVTATGYISNNEFIGEYKFQGMTYGVNIVIKESNPDCEHPRSKRNYIGMNTLQCGVCGLEFR